ncbi:MAG: FkbM family methyltransferase [Thermoleophilaceae bacterium]
MTRFNKLAAMLRAARRRLAALRHRDLYALMLEMRGRLEQLETRVAQTAQSGAALHGTYVGDGRMLVETTWGGRLLIPADDLSLMPELVARGTYDVPFTAFVQRHVHPGDVAIDVGAHVGLFTLLLAYQVSERGRVVAYEPHPRLVSILRDNVAMNWLDDRVDVVPRAAAADAGRAQLLMPQRFQMLSSIHAGEELLVSGHRGDRVESVEVDTEPLDAWLGRLERIDLLKVDAEGAEEQVFAGMAGLLESDAVRRICFEMIRPSLGDDWEPFARRLKALEAQGWRFATLTDSGLIEPAELDGLLERGWWSQVVMLRADELS